MTEVTAYVSSRDRYFTTLPTCLFSIAHQTLRPKKIIIFLDGEHPDLRTNDIYAGLFRILDSYGIGWEVLFGPGKGQVHNHNSILNIANTEWIWRVDDDTFPAPNVLEKLLAVADHRTGAVGGLVLDPRQKVSHAQASGKISDIYDYANVQWCSDLPDLIEVDHLYSTFIFRRRAGVHGYSKELSPAGHREETIFTHEMKRKRWKLLVTPAAITWHCRQSKGGIRTHINHPEYWAADEKVFAAKMKEWGVRRKQLIVLDNGVGDHLVFKSVLPTIRERYADRDITLAVCYPEVFEGEGLNLISIADAKVLGDIGKYNVYGWCDARDWNRHISEAFLEMYK